MNLQSAFWARPPSAALCAASSTLAASVTPAFGDGWAVGERTVYFHDGVGYCDCTAYLHGAVCRHLLAASVAAGWAVPYGRFRYIGTDAFAGLA